MEPAESIIKRLGGPSVVAKIAGVHRTRVSNWKRPAEKGGSDGRIPSKHIQKLLGHAADNKIELTAADFFPTSSFLKEASE